MSSIVLNSIALRKSLVQRFSTAMLLVLATIAASLTAVHWHLQQCEHDGYFINVSGRQRMLSQRVALLAAQYASAETQQQRLLFAQELADAVETMTTAHQELLDYSERSETLSQEMTSLDLKVGEFLSLASGVLDQERDSGRATVDQLVAMSADGDLLLELDSFVESLEQDYNATISQLQLVLLVLAVLSTAILLVISFGIFKPTIEMVSSNLDRLETSNSELTEFSYRISHDLRSPVVSALGIAEVAKYSLQDKEFEEAEESIDHVLTSLNRVSITIEDIVSLVKQKMVDVEPEVFQLSELVDESLEVARHMSDFENVTLSVSCPEDCEVRTKRVYLKQTLENLVSNAVKYRDTAENESQIDVSVTIAGGDCRILIADNGLGIEEGYREKMFTMFQRFHPTVSSGTGLGLYLVAQNVAALDGTIDYKPLAKGSQFDISFPTLGA